MTWDRGGLLERIRNETLDVYRASPIRLREDASQEAEIAHDYQGRLIYELLQNADDAMAGEEGRADRVSFRVTDTDLWVANTGRPLTEADIRGLCGIGAGTKDVPSGPRRASIGHKGMGFKSILELTSTPTVYSTTWCLEMDATRARASLTDFLTSRGQPAPARYPIMRFPWPVETMPRMGRSPRIRVPDPLPVPVRHSGQCRTPGASGPGSAQPSGHHNLVPQAPRGS